MAEASIVDRQYVRVGLCDKIAEGVGPPTLSNMAGIAVDFFGGLARVY